MVQKGDTMGKKQTFLEDIKGMWRQLSRKEQVLYIVQTVLGITILVVLLLGCAGVDNTLVNRIDLALLAVLFMTSAMRDYPQRKRKNTVYILCAIAALFALFMNIVNR